MAYLSKLCLSLKPYTAGEQPQDQPYIKLNTNENPYPPSPRVLEAVIAAAARLRLYPDMEASALRQELAAQNGLTPAQVFCGNGSDEILGFAFAAFFAGKTLWGPDITYSFYPVYAQLMGIDYRTLPLAPDFSIDVSGLMVSRPVVLANPNAPTGRFLPLEALEALARHTHACGEVLLIDEAYAAFAPANALPLLKTYDNVLIVRTFSKSHGLAGLRVGYALGSEALISGLERVKNSFNSYPLDCLAQAGALAALRDEAYYAQTTRLICQTREQTRSALSSAGLEALPSGANFLFVKAHPQDAASVKERLKRQGILVRHFPGPRTAPYLRVSIGTPRDMAAVVTALTGLDGRAWFAQEAAGPEAQRP